MASIEQSHKNRLEAAFNAPSLRPLANQPGASVQPVAPRRDAQITVGLPHRHHSTVTPNRLHSSRGEWMKVSIAIPRSSSMAKTWRG